MFPQMVSLERLYISEEAGVGLWAGCFLKESFEKTVPEGMGGF